MELAFVRTANLEWLGATHSLFFKYPPDIKSGATNRSTLKDMSRKEEMLAIYILNINFFHSQFWLLTGRQNYIE